MNKTKIEWVKNPDGTRGWVWNPITGCLNNCEYCYARKLANTRLRERYLWNDNIAPPYIPTVNDFGTGDGERLRDKIREKLYTKAYGDPFYPRLWRDKLYHPFNGKPKGIFVCSMSDLFGIGIPEEWTQKVLNLCRRHGENRYYLLTKQPQNLSKFSPFPSNCFVGVSATNQHQFDEAMKYLKEVEATVKFLSFEPLLERIDANLGNIFTLAGISGVILGSQTKPTVMPKKAWVDEITEACKKASIPYFLKNNLRPLMGNDLVQDMPKGVEIDY